MNIFNIDEQTTSLLIKANMIHIILTDYTSCMIAAEPTFKQIFNDEHMHVPKRVGTHQRLHV